VKKYWLTLKISLQDLLEYRFDFLLRTVRYTTSILMLAFLWLAVAHESTSSNIDPKNIISYYLFSAMIYGLSNFHTDHIEEDVRLGYISKYLVKPVSPFWMYFFNMFAQTLAEVLVKIVLFIPAALLLGYVTFLSPVQFLLCVIMGTLVFFAMFCLYFGLSGLAFWFQYVDSIRMCVMFTFRFLSGIFISVSFFPSWYQFISRFLPFEYMAYIPIQMMQGNLDIRQSLQAICMLVGWTFLFYFFQYFIWQKATHSYESTGI